MRRKLAAIVAGAMMVGNVIASDVKMTPMFDISYMHSDAQKPSDATVAEGIGEPNSVNDLDVQYAGIAFSGSSKNLNWMVDVNFAGDASNAASTTVGGFVDQATLTQSINDNFSITAGRFYTFVGFEHAMSKDNWNYTKSIANFVSPIYHEGVGAMFDAKNGFTGSLYLVDGISNSEDADSAAAATEASKRGLGLTASYAMDKFKFEADYFSAANRTTLENTVQYAFSAKYDVTDQFVAALAAQMGKSENTTAGQEQKYSSYAAYLKFKATEKFFAALRYEMFKDEADTAGQFWYSNTTNFPGYTVGTDKENKINSITLTAGYDLMNGSELKLEYRADSSDRRIYTQKDQTEEDSNNVIALAWLYSY